MCKLELKVGRTYITSTNRKVTIVQKVDLPKGGFFFIDSENDFWDVYGNDYPDCRGVSLIAEDDLIGRIAVITSNTRDILNHDRTPAIESFEALRLWGETVFGEGSATSLARRACKEMVELLNEAEHGWTDKAVEEAADVVVILTRAPGLWEAIVRKMNINFGSEWILQGDGTGSRVKKE